MTDHKRFWRRERGVYRILIVICALTLILAIVAIYFVGDTTTDKIESDAEYTEIPGQDPDRIENGIHVRTGLIEAEGLTETINNCTTCHSAKLLIQNRLSKEGWRSTIRWMQETQNLWDLGASEEVIVNYLANNYPPTKKGRRGNLAEVEWYVLKE
jgi:hypothetical protein